MPPSKTAQKKRALYQHVGLILGPIVFALLLVIAPPEGLSLTAWHVVAVASLMAVWWATEAIPVPATSLLPLILFPILGIATGKAAASPYAHPVIFLLLGGFIVAMGMQKSGLHRRLALLVLSKAGDHPERLIAGFMIATALLSMWISNTATTLMMIPIALSVAQTVLGDRTQGHAFTIALFIGIAWSASIGGLGTIIGTPPNAFVVAFLAEKTGRVISFLDWMAFGVPVVLAMIPLAWMVLVKLVYRFDQQETAGGAAVVASELEALGRITASETRIAMVFGSMAFLWMGLLWLKTLPGLSGLSNTVIAIAGAVSLFFIPAGGKQSGALLDWESAEKLPWGVLLLFGGGLSLAAQIEASGLAIYLGEILGQLTTAPLLLLTLAIVTMVIFLTELTSNTATTAALVPVLAAVGSAASIDPLLLAAPVAMAASSAFMLPVATAPNAVIYASNQVTIPQLARAGVVLNILGIFAITFLCYMLIPLVFGL